MLSRVSRLANGCFIPFAARSKSFSTVNKLNLCKVVATVGPASENFPVMPQIVEAGMRIMRLNFSHATYDEADLRVANLKKSPGLTSKHFNLRGVMLDTQGPEIRTGSFGTDGSVDLVQGSKIALTTDEKFRKAQTADKLWMSYSGLQEAVKIGGSVLIDDGNMELKVETVDKATGLVHCVVMNSGNLGSRKGVNLPGARVGLPAMCDKDRQDIRWGVKNDIDYIAVSFVRKPEDLVEIRQYVAELMKEFGYPASHPHCKLIAKIESTEAMENFDSILEEADAIMVARGDLGVEIPIEQMANAQKHIVRASNLAGKPVVVATQMLESMIKNPRPTRAECTDVANAVFDGADCVMLSGESAKGKYPVKSIEMMNKIINNAEQWGGENDVSSIPHPEYENPIDSIAIGAAEASKSLGASCIIVLSKSGSTAQAVSKFRPDVPIVTYVPNQKLGRMLQLHRGIHPVLLETTKDQARILSSDPSRFGLAVSHAASLGFCKAGDKVIIVAAEAGDNVLSTSLSMRITTVH
jgi:pyruvate kinase